MLFHGNKPNINQAIYSLVLINIPNITTLAEILLRYLAYTIVILFNQRGITKKLEITWTRKKWLSYFLTTNQHMKFQDPSMYSSKDAEDKTDNKLD